MPAVTSDTQFLVVMGVLIWVVSGAGTLLRARAWATELVLEVITSGAGRNAVLQMSRDHLDAKLDSIASKVGELGGRIDTMSNKLERRLDKLDGDMQAMHVRVTLLEQRENAKEHT